jgi:hypothetical protein
MELTDHIRDKVREALMATLPDEELDKIMKAEMDKFFSDRVQGYASQPTPFKQMIWDELSTRVKEAIKKWMDVNFERQWIGNSEILVGEAVRKFIPVIMESFATDLVSNALAQIRSRL